MWEISLLPGENLSNQSNVFSIFCSGVASLTWWHRLTLTSLQLEDESRFKIAPKSFSRIIFLSTEAEDVPGEGFLWSNKIIKLMVALWSNCASYNIILNRGPAGKTSLNFVICYGFTAVSLLRLQVKPPMVIVSPPCNKTSPKIRELEVLTAKYFCRLTITF